MISWRIASPVEFEFVSTSSRSETFSSSQLFFSTFRTAFETYEATSNQNGVRFARTTESGSSVTFTTLIGTITQTSSSETSEQGEDGDFLEFTYEVTTTTETTAQAFSATTSVNEGSEFARAWTTTATNSENSEDVVFTTVSASKTQLGESVGTFEASTVTTTTNGQTGAANAFDTVYEDSNLMFVVQTELASQFFENPEPLSDYSITSATRITAPHNLTTSNVRVVDTKTSNNSTSWEGSTFSNEVVFQLFDTSTNTSRTEVVKIDVLPNETATIFQPVFTTRNFTAFDVYFIDGYSGVNETLEATGTYISNQTAVAAALESSAINQDMAAPATLLRRNKTGASYTYPAPYPFTALSGSSAQDGLTTAGGAFGNTFCPNEPRAIIVFDPDEQEFYEQERSQTYNPICAVFKPYGVVVEGSTFGAVSVQGTTLSNVQTAALDRNNLYSPNRFNSVLNTDRNTQINRMLITYPNQSNSDFTIEGKSVTYTRTTASEGNTQTTTSSTELVSMMPSSIGIIGARFWLGGTPEPSATFYQSALGLYQDQDGNTQYFTGSLSTIFEDEEEASPLKYWQPIPRLHAFEFADVGEEIGQTSTALPARRGASYCFLAP